MNFPEAFEHRATPGPDWVLGAQNGLACAEARYAMVMVPESLEMYPSAKGNDEAVAGSVFRGTQQWLPSDEALPAISSAQGDVYGAEIDASLGSLIVQSTVPVTHRYVVLDGAKGKYPEGISQGTEASLFDPPVAGVPPEGCPPGAAPPVVTRPPVAVTPAVLVVPPVAVTPAVDVPPVEWLTPPVLWIGPMGGASGPFPSPSASQPPRKTTVNRATEKVKNFIVFLPS
jgi:hypothetical protein